MKSLLVLLFSTFAVMGADANTNRPPDRPALTISAGFSVFLLRSNEFLYTNDVVVYDPPAKPGDPPTTLTCGWLTAKRSVSGRFETIIAHDRVKIDQGDNHARGALAVYNGTNETMTLTGAFDPGDTNVLPLPVLYSPQGSIHGTKIIYDRLNDKLFVDDPKTAVSQKTLSTAERGTTNSISTNKARGFTLPFPAPK